MLARLRNASRCGADLIWVLVFIFAAAPGISKALVTPVGVFSGVVIHAHAHDDHGHVHHAHHSHHRGGPAGGLHQHNDQAADEGQGTDQGKHRLHVHYDACCPSLVVPILNTVALEHRLTDGFIAQPVQPMQGGSPDNLLRPPIVLS